MGLFRSTQNLTAIQPPEPGWIPKNRIFCYLIYNRYFYRFFAVELWIKFKVSRRWSDEDTPEMQPPPFCAPWCIASGANLLISNQLEH